MADTLKKDQPSGPAQVKDLTITVDRDLCIGAATCSAIASLTFALDEDAKAVILGTAEQETEENIIEAAKSCPVLAIKIDRAGKTVFPK